MNILGVLSTLSYQNRRLSVMVLILLLISGLFALNNLPREEDPHLSERFGGARIVLPGATPERMDALIAEPVLAKLREVEEIDQLEAFSRRGHVSVNIALADSISGKETNLIWSDIRDKIDEAKVEFPAGTHELDLNVRTVQGDTFVLALIPPEEAQAYTPLALRLSERMVRRLRNLPGSKEVELTASPEEEVQVRIDPIKLFASGLSMNDLFAQIQAQNTRLPSGQIEGSQVILAIEVQDGFQNLEQVRQSPIVLPNGDTLVLGDLAEVTKGVEQPHQERSYYNGKPVILLRTTNQKGVRVDRWGERVKQLVERQGEWMPQGWRFEIVFDQSQYVRERFALLGTNLQQAVVIVLLVLLVTLGFRAALVISLALPLTMLGVLAIMGPIGLSLQQMSVTGLIISLGMLIDNPIVILDHYQLMRRNGQSIEGSIRCTVESYGIPLLASTATTVFAFLPVAVAEGPTGEFVGSMAMMVVLAVMISLFLSLTVVPALLGWWENWRGMAVGKMVGTYGFLSKGLSIPLMTKLHRSAVLASLRRPIVGLIIGLIIPSIGFVLFPTIPQSFFPPVDRNMFQINVEFGADLSIDETAKGVEHIRQLLAKYRQSNDIVADVWTLGHGAPRVYYNMNRNGPQAASFAGAFITTSSAESTQRIVPEIASLLRREVPSARILVEPFGQGPPIFSPINVRIVGPDRWELMRLGEQIRQVLIEIPAVTYTDAILTRGSPSLELIPQAALLSASGDFSGQIPRASAALSSGASPLSISESGWQVPVRLSSMGGEDAARMLSQPTLGDGQRALEDLVDVRLKPSSAAVYQEEVGQANRINAWLKPYSVASTAEAEFQQRLRQSPAR